MENSRNIRNHNHSRSIGIRNHNYNRSISIRNHSQSESIRNHLQPCLISWALCHLINME